jgi:ribosomal protein S18 acetylase RimI-like enzyme
MQPETTAITARLRPMTAADAPAVLDVMVASFDDLFRRMTNLPGPPGPGADPAPGLVRIRHLVATDPGGAWVTVDDTGTVDGAALALVREGVWGLSLLVVQPGRQSDGRGSALLREAVAYGNGTRGGIILASEDARALRAYWRAGFTLRAAFDARGTLRNPPPRPPAVRPGRWPEDRDMLDAVSRAVRGAAHGDDIGASLEGGAALLVHPDGGFALRRDEQVRLVAAYDEQVARELLQAALLDVPETAEPRVDFIEAAQDWAIDVVLESGLELHPGGAVAVRGDVGPLRPYLPSGSYL